MAKRSLSMYEAMDSISGTAEGEEVTRASISISQEWVAAILFLFVNHHLGLLLRPWKCC